MVHLHRWFASSRPCLCDVQNSYLGAAPASSVGGARRAASPDPKPDGRSGSPSAQAAASAAAAVSAAAVAAAAAMPHQSLEHAMQTKLSLGEMPGCGKNAVVFSCVKNMLV